MSGMEELAQQRWVQQYLAKLDAREVLSHYGAQNVTEMPGEGGTTELIHSCLYERVEPHHSHGDANPSAALNVEKRFYICYAGGWRGNLFHLIMKLEGKESFSDALLGVSDLIHAGPEGTEKFRKGLAKALAAPDAYASAELPDYHDNVLNGFLWPAPHPYLTHRGITEEVVDFLKLGWDERENRIVFPHFFHEHLVGFQKRAIPAYDNSTVPPIKFPWPGTDPDFPKYRSSSGFPKSDTLYGYDFARQCQKTMGVPVHAIVVESPMSVAKAYSLGIPFVMATFGAKVSDTQIKMLSDFDTITVWFDADPAGYAGEERIVRGLSRGSLQKVRVVRPDFNADLADCNSKEEIQYKLGSAVPGFLRLAEYDIARPKEKHGRPRMERSGHRHLSGA